ncbi:CdaR family transcriptional regulator [Amycolatopsis sp. 195334CR]|uniref:PucR family transcriptional regulator n=1 Tax=Amycolatopsis sp. 195334CR TaxID=2814588 RepID=UPI001A8CB5E0|nr:helix-turn-helix domain-containing protein [Amycolatopsis sp. 195334CR]MBN6040178.1 helix-turn-helix domain-containing protein [Amycolatopsis sp. 195334CR]
MTDGPSLRQLLAAIGEPLVQLGAGSADLPVHGLAILDPDDDPGAYRGELVLIIGARGRDALRYLRAAARRGAAAVAVKSEEPDTAQLEAAAGDAGIGLLVVQPRARWDQLSALIRELLDSAALTAGLRDDRSDRDLFSLAQTVAALTGGIVSIEDATYRLLAYSRSDSEADEVDELRRLTILGWKGPERYLELLREWGVYQRLRSGEEVVDLEERPELGIRRRLAVGIRAGSQHLGAIWVQQGGQPFTEQAGSALVGAARMAALSMLTQRGLPGTRSRDELVTGLLDGRVSADLVAGQLGLDPAAPSVVLAFAARTIEPDLPEHELHLAELARVVSVHVTAHRRNALVGSIGGRVYAVLPTATAPVPLAERIVEVLKGRTALTVQAGIGGAAPSLREVVASRAEADRVLDAVGRTPDRPVGTIGDLRAEVLLGETLSLLEAKPELHDPAVASLVEHDATHGTELVGSLLAYLDALGDVRAAAARLHVHPNTLRHRVRRAATVGGLDLEDPAHRLVCHLNLLLATRT